VTPPRGHPQTKSKAFLLLDSDKRYRNSQGAQYREGDPTIPFVTL
jgi:hypothetical protein